MCWWQPHCFACRPQWGEKCLANQPIFPLAMIPFSLLSLLQMLQNLSNFKFTQETVDYCKAKFQATLSPAHMIISWCLEVRTTWDATRYCDTISIALTGQNHKAEDKILKRYPPIYSLIVHKTLPFVVMDMHQNGLVWYLPDIISGTCQVCDHGHYEC